MNIVWGQSKKQRSARLVIVALALFFGLGYAGSDALFWKRLVARHDLKRPADAWQFLSTHIESPRSGEAPIHGLSARGMLEKRRLYCDEGALVMATLLREMGYASRLVDLHGHDGVSHHTILEVEENGSWHRYDTLKRTHNVSLQESARLGDFVLTRPVRRPSWNWYRSVVYYNGFAKMLIFKMRGIPA